MTHEYASSMWLHYLKSITLTDEHRIIENPAFEFTDKVHSGFYDTYSDADYMRALNDVDEEASFFGEEASFFGGINPNPRASAYTVFLNAFRKLPLRECDYTAIAEILADASEKIDFRHMLPPYPQEDPMLSDTDHVNNAHSAHNAQKG